MQTDPEIIQVVKPYTLCSTERIQNSLNSVEAIVTNGVQGDIIECGVWKGGMVLAMLLKLKQLGVTDRVVHLYDTFDGMTPPSGVDVDLAGNVAANILESVICRAPIDVVRDVVAMAGYPEDRVVFHVGDILETDVKKSVPCRIALLRMDLDWYNLTCFLIAQFIPRVQFNGIVIVDDYGHWQGCRKAIDEYVTSLPPSQRPQIQQIDYTGVWWTNKRFPTALMR